MSVIKGKIRLPGDKSISHRAALFAALYDGVSHFSNFNFNRDCSATLEILNSLGIHSELKHDLLYIHGKALHQWRQPSAVLDARNSGTTARLMSGLLANLPFETSLAGDSSLSRRPMKRILEPLKQMGAHISATDDHLPMTFHPADSLRGIQYRLPVASAQVKSAVLLAGLFAEGETEVIESIPSRDHSERMLNLRKEIHNDGTVSIFSSSEVQIPSLSMTIPGDFSSAAFFLSGAFMLPGSELSLRDVSLNPTRTGFLRVLELMGAKVEVVERLSKPEPVGDIEAQYQSLQNIDIPVELVPNIIDEIPILTLLATQAEGAFVVRGAEELRHKESDRIKALVENLRRIGVQVEELEDGLQLKGPQKLGGGEIATYGDHRIAMAFAMANLVSESGIALDDPNCVAVSFPEFWDILEQVTR